MCIIMDELLSNHPANKNIDEPSLLLENVLSGSSCTSSNDVVASGVAPSGSCNHHWVSSMFWYLGLLVYFSHVPSLLSLLPYLLLHGQGSSVNWWQTVLIPIPVWIGSIPYCVLCSEVFPLHLRIETVTSIEIVVGHTVSMYETDMWDCVPAWNETKLILGAHTMLLLVILLLP